jgi:hypothetical protein
MREDHYTAILEEVRKVKEDLILKLNYLEERIQAEMALKHKDIEYKIQDHDKEIGSQKKVMVAVASAIGLSVLYAVLKSIGL